MCHIQIRQINNETFCFEILNLSSFFFTQIKQNEIIWQIIIFAN